MVRSRSEPSRTNQTLIDPSRRLVRSIPPRSFTPPPLPPLPEILPNFSSIHLSLDASRSVIAFLFSFYPIFLDFFGGNLVDLIGSFFFPPYFFLCKNEFFSPVWLESVVFWWILEFFGDWSGNLWVSLLVYGWNYRILCLIFITRNSFSNW